MPVASIRPFWNKKWDTSVPGYVVVPLNKWAALASHSLSAKQFKLPSLREKLREINAKKGEKSISQQDLLSIYARRI
ncbi:hypothetical protein [Shewanella phaeophyticola]|uniref:Uncharacterized protein n=1 Tax=Shewanella phaeophyticola TaxID=2978345 RepID=A0ABT2P0K5_9GAMM|nr:hypothetical protein [Shewanella sp. KJ10-1]MCT8985926.1 hypothetical protein [Shewanella sp. KJ10-1]